MAPNDNVVTNYNSKRNGIKILTQTTVKNSQPRTHVNEEGMPTTQRDVSRNDDDDDDNSNNNCRIVSFWQNSI